ncbi:MAG: FAD-dependent oxidoreductase [Pyrinomonadaceae bacterium]|nr:FAD-dependent oxidoreductase [Pyrinomonadaceae bacterium]
MAYEVVVVGGGFGGLTAAALLAARGVSVCLLEKESRAGGCAAGFEKFDYSFETTASLYASWGAGEIHGRVFAELPVAPPEVHLLSKPYVVRLPDHTEVALTSNTEQFEESLRAAFPECSEMAVNFYRELAPVAEALRRVAARVPDLLTASKFKRLKAVAPEARIASRVYAAMNETAAQHLSQTSMRFRRFIDAQLQIFGQRGSEDCAYLYAALALMIPRRALYEISGGAQALASKLVESIRKSGGVVRFDTPVLRLSYDQSGHARGVDLLSGEFVEATRAIVSNLTIWDTYGKLVGLNRTPADVRKRLNNLRGWGAYLLFLGMDEEAAQRLPADHVLALTDWQEGQAFDPETAQFMFAAAPARDTRAPTGKRAVTVSTFTEALQWFAFHEDETEHEAQDQAALEQCWQRMHSAMPELADGIEVIETATPRTFYEDTRRKLGMVGGIGQSLDVFGEHAISHRTTIPNLYLVGDTTFTGNGVASVTQSGLIVANEITRK